MKMQHFFAICCLITCFVTCASAAEKTVSGWVEHISLTNEKISMLAKLDTGAYASSINADNIRVFHRGNNSWVEFDIINDKHVVKHVTYPLIKFITIKSREDENTTSIRFKRPLIKMKICLGNQIHIIDVDLALRTKFNYAFLLGRNDLVHFNIIIDPSKKYLLGTC